MKKRSLGVTIEIRSDKGEHPFPVTIAIIKGMITEEITIEMKIEAIPIAVLVVDVKINDIILIKFKLTTRPLVHRIWIMMAITEPI